MRLGHDRKLILLSAVGATILLGVSAWLLDEGLFLLLLGAFLFLMALGFPLANPRSWRFFFAVLALEIVVAGTAGGIVYREPLLQSISSNRRAEFVVFEMLEACTLQNPALSRISAKADKGIESTKEILQSIGVQLRSSAVSEERYTHIVYVEDEMFDYGTWFVDADKGQIFPVDDTAEGLLTGENHCRPLHPRE